MEALEKIESQPSILAIIAKAAENPAVDADKMERLLAMQERIMDREALIAYNGAIAAMEPSLPRLHKSKQGHNSKYTPLEEIDKAIRPLLRTHGFQLRFDSELAPNGQVVWTGFLMHRGGHVEKASIPVPPDKTGSKNDAQAIGSTSSYIRRYLTCMLLNLITTDEDTDGALPISGEQMIEIQEAIKETNSDEAGFLKYMGVAELSEIRRSDFTKAMNALNQKRKGKK